METAADQASDLLKALSNRHRLLIICQLIDGERSVGELAEFLDLRDSTVSQHLALLRKDGLVSARRDAQTIYYSIASDPARELLKTLYRGLLRASEAPKAKRKIYERARTATLRQVNVVWRISTRWAIGAVARHDALNESDAQTDPVELHRGCSIRCSGSRGMSLPSRSRSVADEKAVFATVESISVVPARGRIGGIIVQLNVREGDPVTSGQAIAAIGDEKLALQMKSLDAQIGALQAQSDQAQIDFDGSRGWSTGAFFPASNSMRPGPRSMSPETRLRARTAERAVIAATAQ